MDDDDDNNNNNNNILVTIGNKHSKHTFPRKASFFVTFPYTTVPIFELLYRYVFSPVLSCRAVVWNNRLMLASSMEIHLSSSSHLTVGPSVTYSVVNASLNNQMPMFTLDVCLQQPISVAARSEARVCSNSLAGIAGSNTAGGMDVCLLCVVR